METFNTSRLSSGNIIFPSRIIIDQQSVTLKDPGLLSSKEKTIPFSRISSVNIDCPFLGFSTIIIETMGEGKIESHGFYKKDVKRMKEIILGKIGL